MASSKKNKPNRILFYIAVVISFALIGSGILLSFIATPQESMLYIFDTAIEKLKVTPTKNTYTGIGENISIKSNINLEIESQKYQESLIPEDQTVKNLITNLNQTTTDLQFIHDKDNKKMLVTVESKKAESKILDLKLLIENSTEYFFIDGQIGNYVNNGNSTYFENITSETTSKDNIVYVLEQISKSLKKNISNEEFRTIKEQIDIDGKPRKLNKTTIEFDNTRLIQLFNKVLEDLKNDERSKNILIGYDNDFMKTKISKNKIYLQKDEKIAVYMHKNFFGRVEKYELIKKEGENEFRYTYEPSTNLIYIVENNIVKKKLQLLLETNKTEVIIYDSADTELGKLTYTSTDDKKTLTYLMKENDEITDLSFESKIENLKKKKSYTEVNDLKLKYYKATENILNLKVNFNNQVSSDTKIEEDTSNAIFASTLEEEKEVLIDKRINETYEMLKGE